MLRPEICKI